METLTLWIVVITAVAVIGCSLWSRQQSLASWKRDRATFKERYRILFDASPRPTYVFDLKTLEFVDVNRAALLHYGYTQEEFLSLTADKIRPPEEMTLPLDRINNGNQTPCMTRHRKKDGTLIDVEVSVHHLEIENRSLVLVTVYDVTDRKRSDEDLKKAHAILFSSVNELRKRESDLRLLAVLGEMLQSCHTSDEARATVPQFLPQIFPEYSGCLLAIKESRNLVEQVAGWGGSGKTEISFPPSDCWALRRGAVHLVEDGRGPRCKHSTSDASATLCIPMMAQGDAIGVLHMVPISGNEGESIKQIAVSVQNLAKAAADQIALALTNIRFREALQHQSIRDPLTTLYNRRYMEESFERELHRSERNGSSVSVIMVDLDHFKSFNDLYGHRVADNMLRVFARYLQRSVRLDDIVCRYGGEEFVLILPSTGLDEAMNRMSEMQEGARRLTIEGEVGFPAQVTFSAGIAAYPLHGTDSETLLRAADHALYDAKQRGRDCISVEVL